MAKLRRKTFVIVLIRRLWINVNITNKFPITASRNIIEYKNIVIHVPESLHIDVCEAFLSALCTTGFVKFICTIFRVVAVIRSDVKGVKCFDIFICIKLLWRCIHSTAISFTFFIYIFLFSLLFCTFNFTSLNHLYPLYFWAKINFLPYSAQPVCQLTNKRDEMLMNENITCYRILRKYWFWNIIRPTSSLTKTLLYFQRGLREFPAGSVDSLEDICFSLTMLKSLMRNFLSSAKFI